MWRIALLQMGIEAKRSCHHVALLLRRGRCAAWCGEENGKTVSAHHSALYICFLIGILLFRDFQRYLNVIVTFPSQDNCGASEGETNCTPQLSLEENNDIDWKKTKQ